MKKIIVVLIAISLVNISLLNAQTNKWRVLMGVSSALGISGTGPNFLTIGFTSTEKSNSMGINTEPEERISINLIPRFGLFIFNNFVIGADICLGLNNQSSTLTQTGYEQTILAAGPFVRYYIPTQKIRPFIECNAAFGSNNIKYDNSSNSDVENSITTYGAGLGIAARIGEKSTFDFMATYNMANSKNQNNNFYDEESVSSIFGVKFGFTFYLGSEPEF